MSTPHDRLRQMRIEAGFSSARTAAKAMHVPVSTYGQYETGLRRFTVEQFERYEIFFQSARVLAHFRKTGKGVPEPDVLAALTYNHIHRAQIWADADASTRRAYLSGLQAASKAAGITLAEHSAKPAHGPPEAA